MFTHLPPPPHPLSMDLYPHFLLRKPKKKKQHSNPTKNTKSLTKPSPFSPRDVSFRHLPGAKGIQASGPQDQSSGRVGSPRPWKKKLLRVVFLLLRRNGKIHHLRSKMWCKQILVLIFIIINYYCIIHTHTIYVYVYNMHFCSNQSMLVNRICQAQLPTPILPPFYFRISYQTWATQIAPDNTRQLKEHIQIGESEVGAKILRDACFFSQRSLLHLFAFFWWGRE